MIPRASRDPRIRLQHRALTTANMRLYFLLDCDPRQPASFLEFNFKAAKVFLNDRDNVEVAGKIRTALASGLFHI